MMLHRVLGRRFFQAVNSVQPCLHRSVQPCLHRSMHRSMYRSMHTTGPCARMVQANKLHNCIQKYSTIQQRMLDTTSQDLSITTGTEEPNAPSTEQTQSSSADPLKHHDYFGVRDLVNLQQLFDARVHYGHKSGTRDQHMLPYIYGTRLGIDIIDLEQTVELLRDSLNITANVAYRHGVILFLSRHLQSLPLVETMAQDCGEYSHCREWKRGTFTNAEMMYGSITRMPDLCIFLSTHDNVFKQHKAVVECSKMNIMTTGVVDTSCDPRLIVYPVPGNDDSLVSIELYCELYSEAIRRGKERRKEDDANVGIQLE